MARVTNLTRLYYSFKPIVPSRVRLALRRLYSAKIRLVSQSVWPIRDTALKAPEEWPGWPEEKKFAVVLSHDVEGKIGLSRCCELMELQMKLGFRACFNFIPEGSYKTPVSLRKLLTGNGFEIGVHDLKHDGKLYRNRRTFRRRAQQINRHLKEWEACGFRAGFMHHQLGWQHDLNILYDASTFDTDPFEPQPDGADTIFPFWVESPEIGGGYVELPYTLAQDYTLLVVLRELGIDIWKRKIDWIADHGGMVFIDTHPDYMNFDGHVALNEYPVSKYIELLNYIQSRYAGLYWHALPKEVAEFVRTNRCGARLRPTAHNACMRDTIRSSAKTIWIDLENTPHIPFFRPIVIELERRGYRVVITARDAFQTCEMAASYGFKFTRIGKHYGQKSLAKAFGLLVRACQLLPFAIRCKPALGLNHGSRAQILLCNLLRIPTVMVMDYEHSSALPLVRPTWEIVPAVISDEELHCKKKDRIRKFFGIKEDVYVPDFTPDHQIMEQLKLHEKVVVTVRPPATEAHYHNPEAEVFFDHFMNLAFRTPRVKVVLLPRNQAQKIKLKGAYQRWFNDAKVVIPEGVVDGLNLLWHSDLAVSGGGTMNREAAALGVPVFSVFRGTIGAVDRSLQAQGRLILIESVADVSQKIVFRPREKVRRSNSTVRWALQDIISHVESVAGA